MAHKQQIQFIEKVKKSFPTFFTNKTVLDVGSMDINGNNRIFFDNSCRYYGLDIIKGKNVDIVCPVHLYKTHFVYDVVISTEMLEHDQYWKESLRAMVNLLKPSGLLMITCATTGRKEHGTHAASPDASPATLNYYKNVTMDMVREALEGLPVVYVMETDSSIGDLYLWGRKRK